MRPVALWLVSFAALLGLPGCVETLRCEPGRVIVEGECVPNPAEEGDAGLFCGSDEECGDPARPVCGPSLRCSECRAGSAALCEARGVICDEAAGRCAECAANTDCADPASPRCEPGSGSCAPCSVDADCAHLASTPVCDLGAGPACVQCTEASAGACGGSVCDAEQGRCALGVSPRSADLCDPCVADAECQPGQLCARLRVGDPPEEASRACLFRRDAAGAGAPGGDCASFPPFAGSAILRSVSGLEAELCVPRLSSCEALRAFNLASCAPAGPEGDPDCGQPGLADGLCRSTSGGEGRCTAPCLGSEDCPAGAACLEGACALP